MSISEYVEQGLYAAGYVEGMRRAEGLSFKEAASRYYKDAILDFEAYKKDIREGLMQAWKEYHAGEKGDKDDENNS